MDKAATDLRTVTGQARLSGSRHRFRRPTHNPGYCGARMVLAFFKSLPSCLIGMEACSSAHHWARDLMKLGRDVRLIPPAYVKAYVRRQKSVPRTQRQSARR